MTKLYGTLELYPQWLCKVYTFSIINASKIEIKLFFTKVYIIMMYDLIALILTNINLKIFENKFIIVKKYWILVQIHENVIGVSQTSWDRDTCRPYYSFSRWRYHMRFESACQWLLSPWKIRSLPIQTFPYVLLLDTFVYRHKCVTEYAVLSPLK